MNGITIIDFEYLFVAFTLGERHMRYGCYSHRKTIGFVLLITSVFLLLTINSAFGADKQKLKKKDSGEDKIQISADQLMSSGRDNYAEFIGNVEMTQGAFVLKSDRLRIYYKSAGGFSKNATFGEQSIERLVAYGNVTIRSDDRTAITDQAEYSIPDGVLVLTGENSKVISGKNTITGSKITLYRMEGRVKVESGPGRRVKATFYQDTKEQSVSP
jgi:lipopolysaccharide export system protein LptA